jgi:hypothetical protein
MRYLLFVLVFSSCSHGVTARTNGKGGYSNPMKADPSEWLVYGVCPKEANCDESTKMKIANHICKEKRFDEAVTFKSRSALDDKQVMKEVKAKKIKICDLQHNAEDASKSRCEWSEPMLLDDHKDAQVFSEVVCRTHSKNEKKKFAL